MRAANWAGQVRQPDPDGNARLRIQAFEVGAREIVMHDLVVGNIAEAHAEGTDLTKASAVAPAGPAQGEGGEFVGAALDVGSKGAAEQKAFVQDLSDPVLIGNL